MARKPYTPSRKPKAKKPRSGIQTGGRTNKAYTGYSAKEYGAIIKTRVARTGIGRIPAMVVGGVAKAMQRKSVRKPRRASVNTRRR